MPSSAQHTVRLIKRYFGQPEESVTYTCTISYAPPAYTRETGADDTVQQL